MSNTTTAFKYTFPIAKAEKRADGYYLVGYASGPEVDTEGERMSPEAIERFSAQINDAPENMRLVYRDAHAPDGVLRDLGEITKAWVNEHFHLGVEVKLDMSNPAADFLYKSVQKGKQYGMSVAGHIIDFIDEYVASAGMSIRTYKNVALDEISNTTRPAWYPSFGTVLAKSIKDASIASATGENTLGKTNEDLLDTTSTDDVEGATKSDDATDVAADETQQADAATESTEETTDKADDETTSDEDVSKAGRKLSGATSARLLGLFNSFEEELTSLGVIAAPDATDSEKSASDAEEDTTEKTDDEGSTEPVITKSDLDVLAAALMKATERIAELEARPATQLPGVITDSTKKAAEDELAEALAKASPSEKMRLAFAAHTSGK